MIDLIAEGENLRMSGELLRANAALARELLVGALTDPTAPAELDLSGLVALDAGGVQLLIALRRCVPTLKLVQPSQPALDVCRRLGVTRYLFEAP